MTNLIPDFTRKSADLSALSQQAEMTYDDEVRASWLVVRAMCDALGYAAKAASCLAELQMRRKRLSDAAEILAFRVAEGIVAIEDAATSIDIERARSNALYATKVYARAQLAQRSAEALLALAGGLVQIVLAEDNCVLIKEELEALKASTPVRTYAIARESFINCSGPPVRFFRGQPYLVDARHDNGDTYLSCRMRSVFMPAELMQQSFDIVKL